MDLPVLRLSSEKGGGEDYHERRVLAVLIPEDFEVRLAVP